MRKKELCVAALVFCAVAVIFCRPLLDHFHYWGQRCWDESFFWNEFARLSILDYHQFPLWNPYSRGGMEFLGHPHSPFLSPMFLVVLLSGAVAGLKIQAIAYLFMGLLGMYMLSRSLGLSKAPSYLSAFVFNLNSIYPLHLREGHFEWMIMGLFPWFFLLYQRALKNGIWTIPAGAVLALFVCGGSVDVISITVTFLCVYSVFCSIKERSWRPTATAFWVFLCALLIGAVKFLPEYCFLRVYPRFANEVDGVDLRIFSNMFLSRDQLFLTLQPFNVFGARDRWHEYGAYVGMGPLALSLLGVFYYFKKHWPLVLAGLVCFLLVMGNRSGLWAVLQHLPIYNMLTTPSRYVLGVVFCIALFSAFGLEAVRGGFSGPKWSLFKNIVMAATVLFIGLDLFRVNAPILKNIFTVPPQKGSHERLFYQGDNDCHVTDSILSNLLPSLLNNKGTVDSWEPMHVVGRAASITNEAYKGEVYLLNNRGKARLSRFSPNAVDVELSVLADDILVLNQNYYKGWRAIKAGKTWEAANQDGLVSIKVEAGVSKVTFRYRPFIFYVGFLISGIASCVFLIILFIKRKNFGAKLLLP